MKNLQKIIQLTNEVTTTSPSLSPKSRIVQDEQLMRDSVKAHDSRRYLLNKNPKNVHQMINQNKMKRSITRDQYEIDHINLNYYRNLKLPINDIPFQQEYVLTEQQTPYLSKYPKLFEYVRQKSIPKSREFKLQLLKPKPRHSMEYGVNFEAFVKKLPAENRVRVQQLYDKYTYKKIDKSLYEESPSQSLPRRYSKLADIQNRILQDDDLRLSRGNQIKLEQHLKQIYQQIRQN